MPEHPPHPCPPLKPVTLTDRPQIEQYFATLREPLSDYSFHQLYTWRACLGVRWLEHDGHLFVFADTGSELSLLLPPIGDGGADVAMRAAFEILDAWNGDRQVTRGSRIEYASDELLGRFDRRGLVVTPMGPDYVYDVDRLARLDGGDLAKKRQARTRFLRDHRHRVERYDVARHEAGCAQLLEDWAAHRDADDADATAGRSGAGATAAKREKELVACRTALAAAGDLGLAGMVVYVDANGTESIRGFTFGEALSAEQSSVPFEKTDLGVKGLAQFIFSEFCATELASRPLVNAGDDWGVEALARTKMSYRPSHLLPKYQIARPRPLCIAVPDGPIAPPKPSTRPAPQRPSVHLRPAAREDLPFALELERTCFSRCALERRHLRYLQPKQSAVFLVAESGGEIVGDGIALVRRHKNGTSGRIYSLAVSEAHRGLRIGRQLLHALVDALAQRGVLRVYLEVERDNTTAIRLYEGFGFKSIGDLHDYYADGVHAVHMRYEVVPPAACVRTA